MFHTLLIANRGEIACRIIKTAKSMGIKTIAVYSSADRNSMHVQLADIAYFIGDAPARESYLHIPNIIQVAKESNAEAIHPGYGFLSENPAFAKACEDAHIIFVGPTIAAMEAMASKQLAKQLLQNSNVPLTPGYHGSDQTESTLLKEAQKIGFPVLLKAAQGGGGKGMRAVHSVNDFADALAGAKREAQASFADDIMIIEKLVTHPRHIEVQIMADQHGNVVHVFERDCSIQRRHQKIIEEAPAPLLPEPLRQELAQAACTVARSIHYLGAGTVEFLVENNQQFYFMEMNTRLQVEHPVTEMITGLDLVAWQLKIAAGEPLPLAQEDILAQGHAIECRIYAEDPEHDFLPSIGQIHHLHEPNGEGIRIDTGISNASYITQYYDPMIAKLIAWGTTREQAIQRLTQALASYQIGGVITNIPFLRAICGQKKFQQGELSTHFLMDHSLELIKPNAIDCLIMAVCHDYLALSRSQSEPLNEDTFAWQIFGTSHWVWRYQYQQSEYQVCITPQNLHEFHMQFNDNTHAIRIRKQGQELQAEYGQQIIRATVIEHQQQLFVYTSQGLGTIARYQWQKQQANHVAGQLTAPMPANIVAILKKQGAKVTQGERLLVLEAMKMEHTIHAPRDGVIAELFFAVGDQVDEGVELLTIADTAK